MAAQRSRLNLAGTKQKQIARNLRNDIEAGVLRDGHKVPSTRELAQQWGVSIFTINEAMKVLIKEGLVVSKSRSHRVIQAPNQRVRQPVRPLRPSVLLVGGYAGSGKSELGRIIARETGWPILDKDTTTRPVVEMALELNGLPPHDRESGTYLTVVRPREYEAVMATAQENVECGLSVIVTAPFVQELGDVAWIERTRAKYEGLDAAVTLVWVACNVDTMLTYLRGRGAARDSVKLADWPGYLKTIDPDFRPAAAHSVVNNSTSSETLQVQAKRLVNAVMEAVSG